jgi:hypothetical protein
MMEEIRDDNNKATRKVMRNKKQLTNRFSLQNLKEQNKITRYQEI